MSAREAAILPESMEDIHIDCDTQGLISLAMILVAAGWDARSELGDGQHSLTIQTHRKLALEAVAAIKLAALSKQRKKRRMDELTNDGDRSAIVGVDGEPLA